MAIFAQNLGEGIYITNESGEILDANAAFLIVLFEAGLKATEAIACRLEAAGQQRGPVSFSFAWAAREEQEALEETVNRADRELIQVRVVSRPGQLYETHPSRASDRVGLKESG